MGVLKSEYERKKPIKMKMNDANITELNYLTVYQLYFDQLMNICTSSIRWEGLPDYVDKRILEKYLATDGMATICVIDGTLYIGRCMMSGELNGYGLPERWQCVMLNGVTLNCDASNSVIIFNNYWRTSAVPHTDMYAKQLANLNLTRDIHTYKHRNPVAFSANANSKLSIKNLKKSVDNYDYAVIINQNLMQGDQSPVSTLMPANNYLSNEMCLTESYIWQQALNYYGICNTGIQKKERMITDEVTSIWAGALANRRARMETREEAAEKLHSLGVDVWPVFETYEDLEEEGDEEDE